MHVRMFKFTYRFSDVLNYKTLHQSRYRHVFNLLLASFTIYTSFFTMLLLFLRILILRETNIDDACIIVMHAGLAGVYTKLDQR